MAEYTITFKRKVGPTIDGRKPLLTLSTAEKGKILRTVQKDWRKLIELHFEAEGGVTLTGAPRRWKPLSEKYVQFKEREDLLPDILQASTPTLADRYKQSVKYNSKSFSINIEYPELMTGGVGRNTPHEFADGSPVTAIVHQLGQPKRRIIASSFKESAKKRLLEYFTK